MTEFNPSPVKLADLDAEDRFALALCISIVLHLVLTLGVQIKAAPQSGTPQSVLQVRIDRPTMEVRGAALSDSELAVVEKTDEPEIVEPQLDQKEVPPTATPDLPPVEQPHPLLPALEIPLLEDPTWYWAKQLDVHPTALNPINLDQNDGREVEGYGILLLLIDEAGVVRDISVVEESPEGFVKEFQLSAFNKTRFSPGKKNGRAVKSRFMVRIHSELLDQKKPTVIQPPLPVLP